MDRSLQTLARLGGMLGVFPPLISSLTQHSMSINLILCDLYVVDKKIGSIINRSVAIAT